MYDYIIIGAGPGGLDTAVFAAKKGFDVLLIEKDEIGGTCLNRGCIPTKSLLHWAQLNKILLDLKNRDEFGSINTVINRATIAEDKVKVVNQLRDGASLTLSGVKLIKGEAELINTSTVRVNDEEYMAKKIIIATGSKPSRINIPGEDLCYTSDEILEWTCEWDEEVNSFIIIGGGVIGIEFATIFRYLYPNSQVTVLEYCKEILPPFDKEIAKRLRTILTRNGIKIITSASVNEVTSGKIIYEKNGNECSLESDKVIMATGRVPVFPSGLEKVGISYTSKGILVDDNFMSTAKNVYAIGDVNGRCMLAHAATAQGKKVLGEDIDTLHIPSAVFSIPECSMVGLTEDQCKDLNKEIIVKKAFFRANGKAVCADETDGLIKLIIDKSTNTLLGAHICGPHASDLITEPAIAVTNNLNINDIKHTVHSHPTLNEIIISALNE